MPQGAFADSIWSTWDLVEWGSFDLAMPGLVDGGIRGKASVLVSNSWPKRSAPKEPKLLSCLAHVGPMASKLVLLPTLLLALAFVTFCAPSFVFGGRPAPTSSLRSTARAAVPEALELQTSMTTALEVSTPGWWANIVLVVVPCAILIILYLQSEKRKYEIAMGKKWVATRTFESLSSKSFLYIQLSRSHALTLLGARLKRKKCRQLCAVHNCDFVPPVLRVGCFFLVGWYGWVAWINIPWPQGFIKLWRRSAAACCRWPSTACFWSLGRLLAGGGDGGDPG